MTYCVGILVKEGLALVADTRMSAGPDNISTYRKLHVLVEPGERALAVGISGNLSVAQAVISLLDEGLPNSETGVVETIAHAPTMFSAAQLIGRALRHVRAKDSETFDYRVPFDVSILFGGQIKGDVMRLYLIYPAGNFVESGEQATFLQVGEQKFGKSILNRALMGETDLYEALKIGLLSMDDALLSNVEVGVPIDIALLRRDSLNAELVYRISEGEPYFYDLRARWSAAQRAAQAGIPRPPYRNVEVSGRFSTLRRF